jgi:hypothetical protein
VTEPLRRPGPQLTMMERLARKILDAELRFQDGAVPRSRKDVAALDARAEGLADAISAVVDPTITPFGVREVVRAAIKTAGPRPLATAGTRREWTETVVGLIAGYFEEANS